MFFAEYADDHPAYQKYVLGPNGLGRDLQVKIFDPANGQVLPASTDWAQICWPCRVIGRICDMPWIIPTLIDRDICHALILLLLWVMSMLNDPSVTDTYLSSAVLTSFQVIRMPGLTTLLFGLSTILSHLGIPLHGKLFKMH